MFLIIARLHLPVSELTAVCVTVVAGLHAFTIAAYHTRVRSNCMYKLVTITKRALSRYILRRNLVEFLSVIVQPRERCKRYST